MRKWLSQDEFESLKEKGFIPATSQWMPEDVFYGMQKRRKGKAKKSNKKKSKGSHRMSESKRNFKERADWQNRHHMVNKCRGGNASTANILMMDERRHAAFHLLFRNMDFLQVANLLLRCYCMKSKTERFYAKVIMVQKGIEEEWHGEGLS